MQVRSSTPDDISLIFSFIQKKAEFDRNIGAFSGVLQVSEDKLRTTLFGAIPFAYVLFAMSSGCEIGFALYGFRYSSFAGQASIWLDFSVCQSRDEKSRRWSSVNESTRSNCSGT